MPSEIRTTVPLYLVRSATSGQLASRSPIGELPPATERPSVTTVTPVDGRAHPKAPQGQVIDMLEWLREKVVSVDA